MARRVLALLALLYALLAGLRTVADFDAGWQLAAGRFMFQHHQLLSTDVFSYTARGQEWIYPALSQIMLYVLYLVGGFAALSWLNALACAGTIALTLTEGTMAGAVLAVAAVPSIAFRTGPRADLFTTVLFAAFLTIFWRHHRGRPASLWALPALMVVWVNCHLGFVAGLGLLVVYAVLELLEFPFTDRRAAAAARLRAAAPWLAGAAVATLLNPWGWRIYEATWRQERGLSAMSQYLGEWSAVRISPAALWQALAWRDPNSSYWWLLAAAGIALLVSLWRKRFGAALLLAGAAYFSLAHIRFQPLLAIVTVIVGGTLLAELRINLRPQVMKSLLAVLLLATATLVGVRSADLVTNRSYLAAGELSLFGTGLSWWYPERALAFVEREQLPGNLFHDFELGGYLTWRLAPQYSDYIDGRLIPFGSALFAHYHDLKRQLPESPAWQQEADARGINTLIFSVARYAGLGSVPLPEFCRGAAWAPVYLDDVAVIFVRNRPENAALIQRLRLDCATAPLNPPGGLLGDHSARGRAELFNFYSNAGALLYVLSRDEEAKKALDQAQGIFFDDPNLHLTRGQLFEADRRIADAEHEYTIAVQLRPSDNAWYSLARVYSAQHRYSEAVAAVRASAQLSANAADRYLSLGRLYLAMQQPRTALDALAEAATAPRQAVPGSASDFDGQLAELRARAYLSLGDLGSALRYQQRAVDLAPSNPGRWNALADVYQAQGRADLAQQAHQRAQALMSTK